MATNKEETELLSRGRVDRTKQLPKRDRRLDTLARLLASEMDA